jgi:hypothetical protein
MLILFEDGIAEELRAERIGETTFRLSETPLASATTVRRGDVVELADEGKIWRFVAVTEPSPHVTIELVVPTGGWTELRDLFDFVAQIGGEWERAYGGVVLLHVPPAHAIDVERRVRELG